MSVCAALIRWIALYAKAIECDRQQKDARSADSSLCCAVLVQHRVVLRTSILKIPRAHQHKGRSLCHRRTATSYKVPQVLRPLRQADGEVQAAIPSAEGKMEAVHSLYSRCGNVRPSGTDKSAEMNRNDSQSARSSSSVLGL